MPFLVCLSSPQVSSVEPMDPARNDWFQQAARLSCTCLVFPNATSACGFDPWFCLSLWGSGGLLGSSTMSPGFFQLFLLRVLSFSTLLNGYVCLSPNTGHRGFQDRVSLQLGSFNLIMWVSLLSLKTISDFLLPVRQNRSSLLRHTSFFITWFQPLFLVPRI